VVYLGKECFSVITALNKWVTILIILLSDHSDVVCYFSDRMPPLICDFLTFYLVGNSINQIWSEWKVFDARLISIWNKFQFWQLYAYKPRCIGGIFMTEIFGNFYAKQRGGWGIFTYRAEIFSDPASESERSSVVWKTQLHHHQQFPCKSQRHQQQHVNREMATC